MTGNNGRHRIENKITISLSKLQPRDMFAIKVVAVAYGENWWSAYEGPENWTAQRVALHGDRLSEEQAAPLFYAMRTSGRTYYR